MSQITNVIYDIMNRLQKYVRNISVHFAGQCSHLSAVQTRLLSLEVDASVLPEDGKCWRLRVALPSQVLMSLL